MRRAESIVYLNYSPYENSGHILDFLLENFEKVYLFSIAHHSLGRPNPTNKLAVYINGRMTKEEHLPYIKAPESLLIFLVPLRSIMNAYQIITKIISIRNNMGSIDVFFTVNAFIASVGRVLKFLRVVNKTIFWVWDYYSPDFPTISGRLLRRVYWQFDKFATFSDKVFYLNHLMADIRKDKGVLRKECKVKIIPIGMGEMLPIMKKSFENVKLGFIGVLKKSQGIDMLMDSSVTLEKYFRKLTFEIIGSGPDEKYFKSKIKKSSRIKYNFYGYVDENKFKKILYNSTIGISPYSPEEGNVSRYTDPGKPKRYMEFNLPVITTDVIELSKEIKLNGAGEIVEYGNYLQFANLIKKIISKYYKYVRGAIKVHKNYYYKKIYKPMFS